MACLSHLAWQSWSTCGFFPFSSYWQSLLPGRTRIAWLYWSKALYHFDMVSSCCVLLGLPILAASIVGGIILDTRHSRSEDKLGLTHPAYLKKVFSLGTLVLILRLVLEWDPSYRWLSPFIHSFIHSLTSWWNQQYVQHLIMSPTVPICARATSHPDNIWFNVPTFGIE